MSVVTSADEAMRLVEFGTQMRAVATTTMNARSSRSHAVFAFKYEQQTSDGKSCQSTATFVDLAGREDQSMSQNQSSRFREMCCINTSLFHLANVITKLSKGLIGGNSLSDFRNSKLTLLLSPALMGNSRTALIATVTPLRSLVEDSLCTMNFAANVKKIRTQPVINNKAPDTMVAELEAEVRQLKSELAISKSGEMEKKTALSSAEALINSYKRSWDEAQLKSHEQEMTRKKSLQRLGLAVEIGQRPGDTSGEMTPFLTKLSDDPAMQGRCNYFLRQDALRLGSDEQTCNVVLQGLGILPQMCQVRKDPDGAVVVELLGEDYQNMPRVLVNGSRLSPSDGVRVVNHGASVFLGYSNAFRLVVPSDDIAIQVGSTDACVMARSLLEKLDVTTAVHEVIDVEGEQFKDILPYISHLSMRLADDTVRTFQAALHRVCPSIDEANLITKEVLGDCGLRYELHALTNVFKFSRDVPELVVCLLQVSKRSESDDTALVEVAALESAAPAASQFLGEARHPLVQEMGLSEHMTIGNDSTLIYVWSLEKFLGRLNAIREIYQQGSEAKDNFMSVRHNLLENPDQNPWKEVAFGEVQLLKEKTSICNTLRLDSERASHPIAEAEERHKCASGIPACGVGITLPLQAAEYHAGSMSGLMTPRSSQKGSSPALIVDSCTASDQSDTCSQSLKKAAWATALGSKVDVLGAEVAQMQEALLRQRAADAADSSDVDSVNSNGISSEEVARWLGQVEELRTTLKSYVGKSPKPTAPSDEDSQNLRNFKKDVVKMLRDELQDQLQNIGSDRASTGGSTGYASGACSGGTTPADEQNNVIYCPKRTCPLSRSGSDETLSSRASTPSQAYRATSSQMRVVHYGPSAGTVRRLSTKNCRNSPATHTLARTPDSQTKFADSWQNSRLESRSENCCRPSSRSPRSLYTNAVPSSSPSTLTEGKTKSRSPSSSPTSKRLIGPYPQITWRYYEVSDPEVRRRSI
jgi:hypothetical protein